MLGGLHTRLLHAFLVFFFIFISKIPNNQSVFVVQIMKSVKSIKQCDSGLGEELAQMRELYRREALQRKLLYNQVPSTYSAVLSHHCHL